VDVSVDVPEVVVVALVILVVPDVSVVVNGSRVEVPEVDVVIRVEVPEVEVVLLIIVVVPDVVVVVNG